MSKLIIGGYEVSGSTSDASDIAYKDSNVESALDNICDYSTTEVDTGKKWINGKPIYRKVVDVGALPNSTTKYIAHGISNLELVVNLLGISKRDSPFTLATFVMGGSISIYIQDTNIRVYGSADYSAYYGYAVVEYTKTTD